MANVSFEKIWEGFIGAGVNKPVYWINAPSQRVWAFSAEAKPPGNDEFLPGPVYFTISGVTNQLLSASSRRIRVDIKNTGSIGWTCILYMARISA